MPSGSGRRPAQQTPANAESLTAPSSRQRRNVAPCFWVIGALRAIADFLEIDEDLIAVAAEASPALKEEPAAGLADWPAATATTTHSPPASCSCAPGTNASHHSRNASTRQDSPATSDSKARPHGGLLWSVAPPGGMTSPALSRLGRGGGFRRKRKRRAAR